MRKSLLIKKGNLLLSPTRGLFFWTPFLAIALIGYWDLVRANPPDSANHGIHGPHGKTPTSANPGVEHEGLVRPRVSVSPCPRVSLAGSSLSAYSEYSVVGYSALGLFWLTYAVPLLQVLVISGRVWDWTAGPTLGPRYLAPMLPLLAVPCALGVRRFPTIGLTLAAVSIALTAFAVITNASPPGSLYNPLTDLHWPAFLDGNFQPNLGAALGLPPHLSFALYFAVIGFGTAWLWRMTPNSKKASAE